jgi:plastocyanin
MRPHLALAFAFLLAAPIAASASRSVAISGLAFSPRALSAELGDVVTWTNQDSIGHTVTCDAGSCGFASTVLGHGETFSATLDQSGTLSYHCSIHLSMHGALYVGTALASSPDLAPDPSTLAASRALVAGVVPDPRAAHVGVVVRNSGGSPSVATTVEFHTDDATGKDQLLGVADLPPLPSGGSAIVGVDWPQAPLVGSAPVRVVVDPANVVIETLETNNELDGTVHTGLV